MCAQHGCVCVCGRCRLHTIGMENYMYDRLYSLQWCWTHQQHPAHTHTATKINISTHRTRNNGTENPYMWAQFATVEVAAAVAASGIRLSYAMADRRTHKHSAKGRTPQTRTISIITPLYILIIIIIILTTLTRASCEAHSKRTAQQ